MSDAWADYSKQSAEWIRQHADATPEEIEAEKRLIAERLGL